MTSEALDCHYSITGSGPAIFLTHGVGAAEDAWRFITPKLSENFTVITYDLRGHGRAPVTHKNFGLEELVLDLERVREKVNIDKGHFIGHSLGGMIAPTYAKKYPEKVLSVGMLSTVAGRSENDSKKVWSVIKEMEENGVEKTLEKLTTRWFTDEFIANNSELVTRRLKQVVDTDPAVFLNVFRIYAKTEMISWLKELTKPCLLMTGENDGGCSPRLNHLIADSLSNSALCILMNYKHSLLIEAPHEVGEEVRKFLLKQS